VVKLERVSVALNIVLYVGCADAGDTGHRSFRRRALDLQPAAPTVDEVDNGKHRSTRASSTS
jgi:hypothetical protein